MRLYILKRKTELVWLLAWEGYSDIEIGEMLNIERTWVYRLRNKMPKDWVPTLEKLQLPK